MTADLTRVADALERRADDGWPRRLGYADGIDPTAGVALRTLAAVLRAVAVKHVRVRGDRDPDEYCDWCLSEQEPCPEVRAIAAALESGGLAALLGDETKGDGR